MMGEGVMMVGWSLMVMGAVIVTSITAIDFVDDGMELEFTFDG